MSLFQKWLSITNKEKFTLLFFCFFLLWYDAFFFCLFFCLLCSLHISFNSNNFSCEYSSLQDFFLFKCLCMVFTGNSFKHPWHCDIVMVTDESLLSASDSVNVELRSSFAISDFSDFWTPEVLGTDEMSLS